MTDVYQKIIATLETCRKVLVTTHVRPDGDALGSVTAMVLAMRQKGIDAQVLLLSHLPSKYTFLFDDSHIQHCDAEKGWPADLNLSAFDALLVCDTGTWNQLPGLKDHAEAFAKPILVIDHHRTQESWGDSRLVVKEAGAAGEIVAELIELWGVTLDPAIATALFIAITTDTGWFQFSNTRPFTFRLAATLLEAGVDMDGVYQRLYLSERAQRVDLQTRAMQSMKLLADGRLAVMRIEKKDFQETGANVPDTENMINIPMQIQTVQVVMLVTEPMDFGPVRVSLRSKGQVDVAEFAQKFGGGGHARAAGLKVEHATLQDAWEKVVGAMMVELDVCPESPRQA